MAPHQVLDAQPVREYAHCIAEHRRAAQRIEVRVIVGGGEPDAQAFAEAVVAEVVETGLAARGLENGVFPQRKRPAARCLDGGALRIVEPRTGQVVDANFGGAHLAPARFQAIE